MPLKTYETLAAFYDENDKRRKSPEWDYGVHWRATAEEPWPRWRVSWVVETGELYAVRLGVPERVHVLGLVEKVGPYPYAKGHDAWQRFNDEQPIEQLLDGWAYVEPPLLSWVSERIATVSAATLRRREKR